MFDVFSDSTGSSELSKAYYLTWYNLFSPLGILIGTRAYTNKDRIRFYEVGDVGLLIIYMVQSFLSFGQFNWYQGIH